MCEYVFYCYIAVKSEYFDVWNKQSAGTPKEETKSKKGAKVKGKDGKTGNKQKQQQQQQQGKNQPQGKLSISDIIAETPSTTTTNIGLCDWLLQLTALVNLASCPSSLPSWLHGVKVDDDDDTTFYVHFMYPVGLLFALHIFYSSHAMFLT